MAGWCNVRDGWCGWQYPCDEDWWVWAYQKNQVCVFYYPILGANHVISGHTDEINQLKCNPSRTRLATCSDDHTARVWNVEKIQPDSDESIPGLITTNQTLVSIVLSGHTSPVTTMGWMPEQNSSRRDILATSSFDCTVRIWDSATGKCMKLLTDHQRPVYTLTFSPDGKWLATGSGDGWVHVYWVKVCLWAFVWSLLLTKGNRHGRNGGPGLRVTTNVAYLRLRGKWCKELTG